MKSFPGEERLEKTFELLRRADQLGEESAVNILRVRQTDEEDLVKAAIQQIRERRMDLPIDCDKAKIKFGPKNGETVNTNPGSNLKPIEFREIFCRIKEVLKQVEGRKAVPSEIRDIIDSARESSSTPVPVRPGDIFRMVRPSVYRILQGLEVIMPGRIDKSISVRDLFARLSERSQKAFYPSGKYSKESEEMGENPDDPINTLRGYLNDKESIGTEKLPKKIIDALFLGKGQVTVLADLDEEEKLDERKLDLKLDEDCFVLEWSKRADGSQQLNVYMNLHRSKLENYDPKNAVVTLRKDLGQAILSVYKNSKRGEKYVLPILDPARLQIVKVVRR